MSLQHHTHDTNLILCYSDVLSALLPLGLSVDIESCDIIVPITAKDVNLSSVCFQISLWEIIRVLDQGYFLHDVFKACY